MSLIDRYVAEVGRHLPGTEREDLEKEIRSTLEDTIEENAEKSGKPANDESISAVLKQYGDPELLAQKYSPRKRYLIGRQWYEIYIQILKRVLGTALPISLMVLFFVKFTETPDRIINVLIQAFGETFNIGIHIWFWITIVFVILEHAGVQPSELDGGEHRDWAPDRLPALPKKRQISFTDAITDLITSAASVIGGLVLISISPWMMPAQSGGEAIAVFHPTFLKLWVPAFLVIAVLIFIHDLFKLKIGNWTPALTITNAILSLVSIGFTIALFMSQQIVNPVFLAALSTAAPELQESITWTIGITLAIVIGIHAWSIYNSILMAKRLTKKEKS